MITQMRRWGRRVRAFHRLDARVQGTACEAIAMLALARLLVLAFPFYHIAKRLVANASCEPVEAELSRATTVARMVRTASAAMPFRAMCLEQAVATAAMLRRRHIRATIHLGTARNPQGAEFEAHAWLSVAGEVMVGGPIDRYTELTQF
jgi:hypothetical protein